MGGAERVLEVLHEVFPEAPVYTSMYEPALVSPSFGRMEVHTSFMQRLPFATRRHQAFLPFYPAAFEQFDLSGYDVVLSMSSAWSKGVVTQPETCHVCYCLTPMRFAWQSHAYAAQERIPRWSNWLLPHILTWLRTWDAVTAQRVDAFAAISRAVATRITKYYRRSAAILHPPVDTQRYEPSDERESYFLVVSRLIPYKRIDLAVRACTELGLPLKVVGTGRDRTRLQSAAGPTVEFLGRLPDDTIRGLMARCRALLFPGEEDFGLTPLEVQASGRPVIALARGGALETVADGATGLLFPEPTVESLAAALTGFRDTEFDARVIRRRAVRFDTSHFKRRLRQFVAERWAAHQDGLRAAPRSRRGASRRRRTVSVYG
ncbi:MAG: glycosyl transferase [Dehalococcoidia bacterium]|nr:glycosyl transferase [Dehalococcoidia bacterium]